MSSEPLSTYRKGVDLRFIGLNVPDAAAYTEYEKWKAKAMIVAFTDAVALSREIGFDRLEVTSSSKTKYRSSPSHGSLKSALKQKQYAAPATTISRNSVFVAVGASHDNEVSLVRHSVVPAATVSAGRYVTFSPGHPTDSETFDLVEPSGRSRPD
jgi:hypothetical protein